MPGRASRVVSYMPLNRLDNVLELIKSYPGFSMFRDLPAWDFYIQHVKGITLKNVRFSLYEDDFRPAFIFDDVEKISIYNLSLPLGKKEEEQIIIR